MQEYILATVFRRHEAEATHLIEPLHGAVQRIDGAGALIEIAARRTIAKATAARTAEATAGSAEIAAGRTIAEAAARTTEVAPGRTITEAAARTTEVAPGRTITETTARTTEVTPGRTITETTASATATGAALQLGDSRDKAAPLAVGADLAHEDIVGVRLVDTRVG